MLDVSHKKVLFVGERISDVYHYGKLLGRPLKEAIVCVKHEDTEVFEGGVTAAAAHARDFVSDVQVFSTHEVRKERYVESAHKRKLFEVYTGVESWCAQWPRMDAFDVVVVTDYGHGMMDHEAVRLVCNEARYLAVNVQTNAGNYGFNLATKYPNADYLCVDEPEARLATQNQYGDLRDSLIKLSSIAGKVVITRGREGCIGWSECGFEEAPAVTDRVVDTMGAGDAFFSVTACMAEEASMGEILRIGNAAGALKAQSIGHRNPVTKHELLAYLYH